MYVQDVCLVKIDFTENRINIRNIPIRRSWMAQGIKIESTKGAKKTRKTLRLLIYH